MKSSNTTSIIGYVMGSHSKHDCPSDGRKNWFFSLRLCTQNIWLRLLLKDSKLQLRTTWWLSHQTGRDGDWLFCDGFRLGGAGGAILMRCICFSSFWCMSSMKSCSFFPLSLADPGFPFPLKIKLLLLLSSFVSSSSSDASELRSEFDGEGDCGERFSCSWSIVRKSWMDSFNAHNWDRSERSNWRRPYISLRRMASWVSNVEFVFRLIDDDDDEVKLRCESNEFSWFCCCCIWSTFW